MMNRKQVLRSVCALIAGTIVFGAGVLIGQGSKQPSTVMHVVTLYWKEGITDAQKKAALDGVVKVAQNYQGVKNVWIKSVSVQGDIGEHKIANAIAMEFESRDALKKYSGSDAQKEWYKVYMPARGESRTFDITN
ncbi:MAG: Dabb family protein [Acidobacteria bacterium]|nr:Dabb family protein [Acidobacteriota bacterium]